MYHHPHSSPLPWSSLVPFFVRAEIEYCQQEMAWFQARPESTCVLRFGCYVADLEGTLRQFYRQCLDQDTLPAHAPTQHHPRERKRYLVNRTADQLGIHTAAIEAYLADYVAWVKVGD